MTGPNILDALSDFFDEKKQKQKKCKDDLKKLIEKLERYQKKLKKDLSSEGKKNKVRQLEAELKVVKKKNAKAHKLLETL